MGENRKLLILLSLLVGAAAHAQDVVDEAEVAGSVSAPASGDAAASQPTTLPSGDLAPSATGDEEPKGEAPDAVDISRDEEATGEGEMILGWDRVLATSIGAVVGGITGLVVGLAPFALGVGVCGAGAASLLASEADPRAYQYLLIPPLFGLLTSMLSIPVCSSGLASIGVVVAAGRHDGTMPGLLETVATLGAGLAPVLVPLALFGGGMALLLVPPDVTVTLEALSVGTGLVLVSGVLAVVVGPVLSVVVNNLMAEESEELPRDKAE